MHSTTTTLAFTALIAVSTANPIQKRTTAPYFEVRNFTFTKSTTSSRYQLNIDFPQDVTMSSNPDYIIPGFTTPVPCTGTYFYSPSEDSTITPINARGAPEDKNATVTTKLDVESGDLYMVYTYNTTVNEEKRIFVYDAKQTGLSPVDASAEEGFNTPAYAAS
jgi:hypothetical protein